MNLKKILDEFGWEKVQQGEFPPEIKTESQDYVAKVHQYDLYGLNGVCLVTEDNKNIVELLGIAKGKGGYEIRARTPQNTKVIVKDIREFLDGFKHLHGCRNRFLYVKEENMHIQGMGQRMEEAGELFKG